MATETVTTIDVSEIARLTGGDLLSGSGATEVHGYSINSRTVRPGDFFVALPGERTDGHRYVNDAAAAGASGALVSDRSTLDSLPEEFAVVCVSDTGEALLGLAAAVRRRLASTVIGITGSAGKTTTKEMTYSFLRCFGSAYRSPGNYNSLVGLPLSLLEADPTNRFAVFELGTNHPGELDTLATVADLDVGIYTTIAGVHLEFFGTIEGVTRAKAEMAQAMKATAVLVANSDDERVMAIARAFPGSRMTYGFGAAAEMLAEDIHEKGYLGMEFVLSFRGSRARSRLGLGGWHNLSNALAAASAAVAAGATERVESLAECISDLKPAPMRGVVTRHANGVVLVDDSYNSSPPALKAAVRTLRATETDGRRVLIMGDMLELGDEAIAAHREAGRFVAGSNLGQFSCVGTLSQEAARGAEEAGMDSKKIARFSDSAEAADWVARNMREGDLILVKGSRGMAMERVCDAVRGPSGGGTA